jgi:adenine/guanine phosphoribosyltransferase-like PRPP-binding protein
MPRLLVVHHTPSPALQEMFEAAVRGARTDEIDDDEVIIRPALTAAAVDVLEADGILLGTPVAVVLGTRLHQARHRRHRHPAQ